MVQGMRRKGFKTSVGIDKLVPMVSIEVPKELVVSVLVRYVLLAELE